jgi:predicted metalloenzyme YecM
MKKLALVVDERELSTIRAALLLQEQVDALPEDLAEMIAAHGMSMTASEIEHLSLRIRETAKPIRDFAERELPQATRLVEMERFPSAIAPRGRM